MGPPRKSKSVNKRQSHMSQSSPNKAVHGAKRTSSRKRKLTDVLGPQWTMEELTRFYDSYRRNGKDWKKVAGAVRNRSPDMVEALYSMNKAYLSLPHGTASATGLIAMMTDHYSNLTGSDSDRDSNDGVKPSRKNQSSAPCKIPANASKASEQQHSPITESKYGCLSLLSSGTRPRPVGKRTPRFPVSFSYENTNGGNFSPNKRLKRADCDDSKEVALVLALTEVSQRGASPQISCTPSKMAESVMSSPLRRTQGKHSVVETENSKMLPNYMDEDLEGSTETDTGELLRSVVDGIARKRRGELERENIETDVHNENNLDDIKEECSGTEVGHRPHAARSKSDLEAIDSKVVSSPQKKKSKKALFKKDEGPSFDNLETLVDVSLLMPTENKHESALLSKIRNEDHSGESTLPEAPPSSNTREKRRSSSIRMKGYLFSKSEDFPSKASKSRKRAGFDDCSVLEANQDSRLSVTKTTRRIQKTQSSKMQKRKTDADRHASGPPEIEAGDPGKKLFKNKISLQSGSPNMMKISENSSNVDAWKEVSDSAQSSVQNLATHQGTSPIKVSSRRKKVAKKLEALKDLKLSGKKPIDLSALSEIAFNIQEQVSNCLSNQLVRRFCTFEWFYSAIDFPWFSKREFDEYLNHVGLGHVPRLTRTEWSFIRSSLGKPRRFSQQFLCQEKDKLNQYRDSVREHYTELREGIREGLPTDLARPLSVGQRVTAIHPKTREIHDGSVLTVDHSKCRVQFDRNDLGVEFVMDIDCMPLNPCESMPAMLGRRTAFADRYSENFNKQKTNGREKEYIKASLNVDISAPSSPFDNFGIPLKETKFQAKVADAQALADLSLALDRKEAIVAELVLMNDDVLESQKDGDNSLKEEESFKKQYAAVLMQLNEANEQVSSALHRLRQRNTYQERSQLATTDLADHVGTWDSFDRSSCQTDEAGSHVNDILDSSRAKAQTMLNAAIQAMSSLKNRNGSSIEKTEEAIDYVNNRIPSDDTWTQVAPDQSLMYPPEVEAQYPCDLIMKCIAALVMIQKCTERQFLPPSDVAQILDHAVTSLQPRSSQNLPVYTDMQKCFGIIKNQILALIPT